MGTAPQTNWTDEPAFEVKPGHKLPGYTVDALLAEGKTVEARDELERLLLEGLDSGPGREMTDSYLEQITSEARLRAGHRTK